MREYLKKKKKVCFILFSVINGDNYISRSWYVCERQIYSARFTKEKKKYNSSISHSGIDKIVCRDNEVQILLVHVRNYICLNTIPELH